MTKTVDSQALGVVTRALGLTGAGAVETEFLDGELIQTLDVAPIVRRGRTPAGTQGLFYAVMDNVHTDAETLFTDVQPFTDQTGFVQPFPSPIPPGFDLWVVGATLIQISGGGTLDALLSMQYGGAFFAWGIDDSGVAIAPPTFPHMLAHWDALVTVATIEFGTIAGSAATMAKIGLRLPSSQHTHLTFRSTSSLTATFRCGLLLGLFPIGLGQDAFQ